MRATPIICGIAIEFEPYVYPEVKSKYGKAGSGGVGQKVASKELNTRLSEYRGGRDGAKRNR